MSVKNNEEKSAPSRVANEQESPRIPSAAVAVLGSLHLDIMVNPQTGRERARRCPAVPGCTKQAAREETKPLPPLNLVPGLS